jgi:tripartite-type tricarboxylate transporter receptor subunit TctC
MVSAVIGRPPDYDEGICWNQQRFAMPCSKSRPMGEIRLLPAHPVEGMPFPWAASGRLDRGPRLGQGGALPEETSMRRRSLLSALAALPFAAPALAQAPAAALPNRPIRLVVPFPPGGTTDLLGRLAAREIEQRLGQPVVVENRPGAGGAVGSEAVARSAPDGTTLVLSNIASQAIGPAVNRNITYDSVRDFTHVGLIAAVPSAIAVSASGPYRTLADLLAKARTPGAVRFASTGVGTSSHVKLELLKRAAGVDITHVPYRGSAPAVADVLGGQIDGLIAAVPDIGNNDRLRLLAVTTPERAARWPDVPTVAELGFPDFDAVGWLGILVPNDTPPAVIAKLNTEIGKVMQTESVKKALLAQGVEARTSTPEEFGAMMKREGAKWQKIMKDAGIQPE